MPNPFGIILVISVALAFVALVIFTAPRCTSETGGVSVGGMLLGGCR